MNLRPLLFIAILTFSVLKSNSQVNKELLKSFHSISSNELMEFAEELCSDKYKGRLSGSPKYLDPAKWCASGSLPSSIRSNKCANA